jgi:hypothetical protein
MWEIMNNVKLTMYNVQGKCKNEKDVELKGKDVFDLE